MTVSVHSSVYYIFCEKSTWIFIYCNVCVQGYMAVEDTAKSPDEATQSWEEVHSNQFRYTQAKVQCTGKSKEINCHRNALISDSTKMIERLNAHCLYTMPCNIRLLI